MAFVEGVFEGAEIGSLAGPLGAAAGAVVGGLLALAVGHLVVKAVETANHDASSSLSDHPVSQACADCGDGPDCFEPPKDANREEFNDQLQDQQDEINKLSPDQMLDRLSEGDARKEATGSYRGEGDATARKATRGNAGQEASEKAYERAINKGGTQTQAEQAAAEAQQAALQGKDATHALDWVAGGDGSMSGMGDRSINRSIGSQWSKTKRGSELTRREQLRAAAKKAKVRGQSKMNLKLKDC